MDGRSVDDTLKVAQELRAVAHILLQTGKGKGDALACGLAAATGDVVVAADADGSADLSQTPRLIQALVDGADFAKRARPEGRRSGRLTSLRAYVIMALSTLTSLCFGPVRAWSGGDDLDALIPLRIARSALIVAGVTTVQCPQTRVLSRLRGNVRLLRTVLVARRQGQVEQVRSGTGDRAPPADRIYSYLSPLT